MGAGALVLDLTLPLRLPREADWAEAAGALRARAQAGDAVQIWPAWAERARMFVDAAPVFTEEDLAQADYVGVKRLWLLSLPRVPFARVGRALDMLARRGATPTSDELRFGALAPIGSRFTARGGAGAGLQLRAGVIGERAYGAGRPPITVQIFADGVPLGGLEVPRTVHGAPGWRRLDVPLPPGAPERDFVFAVSSSDAGRPFCLQAWT